MDSSNLIDKTEIKSEIEDKINSYDLILKKLEILSKKVSSFLKSSCVKEGRISSSLLEKIKKKLKKDYKIISLFTSRVAYFAWEGWR